MKHLDTFQDLPALAQELAAELGAFQSMNSLPPEWFAQPDHVAYKCRDAVDYQRVVSLLKGHYTTGVSVQMDGRYLASFKLTAPLDLPHFGTVNWLEVMQPRPEKQGNDLVGLEHMEFVYADFVAAAIALKSNSIQYELQSNDNGDWISVTFGPENQELKLNQHPLADIVAHELAAGTAKAL